MTKSWQVEIEVVSQRGRCPNGHRPGDRWVVGRTTPKGICLGAFGTLLPYLTTIRFGGSFPWEQHEGEGTFSCPDHDVATVFRLRRVEERPAAGS